MAKTQLVFLAALILAGCGQQSTQAPAASNPPAQSAEDVAKALADMAAKDAALARDPDAPCKPEMIGQEVSLPGGTFTMGETRFYPDEGPKVEVTVAPFSIDRTEVTNGQFAKFVAATGYKTKAERGLDDDEFPDLPAELRLPGSSVFIPPSNLRPQNWWEFVPFASWKHPYGPGSNIDGLEHHPAVHIAYQDAKAYADWAGRALPTEAQWEFAARAGGQSTYAWGEEKPDDGTPKANTWQGLFPFKNSNKDGFAGLSPAACYGPDANGLYDMTGNVWEWTRTAYSPDRSKPLPEGYENSGYDPAQPGVPVRVMKGGSFLCAENYCQRYRPAARHPQDETLGASHIGFRTVSKG